MTYLTSEEVVLLINYVHEQSFQKATLKQTSKKWPTYIVSLQN